MRDEPPTSSTAASCSGSTSALRSVRRSASIVSEIGTRIIDSNSTRVSRTSVWRPGSTTGIDASVSLESASFASTHSSRRRASVESVGRVARIETGERVADRGAHVGEDRLVEVDSAEALDPVGRAEDLEPVTDATQHRSVERSAAEVVDRDERVRGEPFLRCVVDRGGLGLADEERMLEPGLAAGLVEQVELVRTPVRGVAHRDRVGGPALALGDGLDRGPQHATRERIRRHGDAAEEERCGVAEAALELAGEPPGVGQTAAERGLAGEDRVVVAQEDDRGDGCGAIAELHGLGALAVAEHRRGSERRAEIDADDIRHASPRPCLAVLWSLPTVRKAP